MEFANRPGVALQDDLVAEMEAALEDTDPFVREVVLLTTIQLHRFRSMRAADLDQAHESVNRLAALNHPAVISALVEVAENSRTGYVPRRGARRRRTTNALAWWRCCGWCVAHGSGPADGCGRLFDRDQHIVKAANGPWSFFPGTGAVRKRGTGRLTGQIPKAAPGAGSVIRFRYM